MSATKSYLESTTGLRPKPLWVLRIFAIASVIPLLLAMLVFRTGNSHNFCVGFSVGLMIGLIVQTFALSSVELKDTPQASDVESLSVTR